MRISLNVIWIQRLLSGGVSMKCACCGRKKKIFESFEELEKDVNICVDCSKILYKYQDAIMQKNVDESNKLLAELKAKKIEKIFAEWFTKFQERLGMDSTDKITS